MTARGRRIALELHPLCAVGDVRLWIVAPDGRMLLARDEIECVDRVYRHIFWPYHAGEYDVQWNWIVGGRPAWEYMRFDARQVLAQGPSVWGNHARALCVDEDPAHSARRERREARAR